MKWVRQFEGPYFIVSKPTSLTAKIQRSPRAQVRVVHIDKLKHFHGTPPKPWRKPEEASRRGDVVANSHAQASANMQGDANGDTDPNVANWGEVPSTYSQLAIGSENVGTDKPTGRRRGRSSDLHSLDQPMGMAETGRVDENFSASMDGREIGEDLSCQMGSARSREELFTDSLEGMRFPSSFRSSSNVSVGNGAPTGSLEGVGFPSSSRFGSSQPLVCSKSMGTPISHERTFEVSSEKAYCAKDRLAPCSVPQEANEMCGSTIPSDYGRAAMAEMESKHGGNRVESSEVEFSSDCPKCRQDMKIPAASIKEGLGVRFDDDLAVPRNNAALPPGWPL